MEPDRRTEPPRTLPFPDRRKLDLLQAQTQAGLQQIRDDMNRQVYQVMTAPAPAPCLEPPRYLGLTRWDRVVLQWGVVRFYFHTLWRALKGDDPYDLD